MKKITVLSLTTINCHRRTCLCRRLFGLAIQTCDRSRSLWHVDRAILLRDPGEKRQDGVRLPTPAAGYVREFLVSARRLHALLVRAETSGKSNPDLTFKRMPPEFPKEDKFSASQYPRSSIATNPSQNFVEPPSLANAIPPQR
jgi:hypothetical protein